MPGGAGLEEWEEGLEGGPAEPWSPDFIRSLLEAEQELEELVTGEEWVDSFRDDPEVGTTGADGGGRCGTAGRTKGDSEGWNGD